MAQDQTGDQLSAAKRKALYLLERMPRTEKQLRDKLAEPGVYDSETIDSVIAYVKSYHYLDDESYARDYIEGRKTAKSLWALLYELRGKGIAESILDDCREAYQEEDATEAICRLMQKKGIDPKTADAKERAKLYRYLSGRGFSYEEIRKACTALEETD